MKSKYIKSIIPIILLSVSLLSGCGSEPASSGVTGLNAASYKVADSGISNTNSVSSYQGEVKSDENNTKVLDESKKLIKTISISAETESYNKTISAINKKVDTLNGYVQNVYEDTDSDNNSRSTSMTIRIPKDKADDFVSQVDSSANILSHSESTEDVTLQYTDIDSRKKAMKTEEKRLMEMMESAKDMTDIVAIEDKLTEVRGNLDSLESQLKVYDNQVDYTTINLNISEVLSYTPSGDGSIGEKISTGFVKSLKSVGEGFVNFFIWLTSNSPVIVIFVLIIFVIVKIIIMIVRRYKKRHPSKPITFIPVINSIPVNNIEANTPGKGK